MQCMLLRLLFLVILYLHLTESSANAAPNNPKTTNAAQLNFCVTDGCTDQSTPPSPSSNFNELLARSIGAPVTVSLVITVVVLIVIIIVLCKKLQTARKRCSPTENHNPAHLTNQYESNEINTGKQALMRAIPGHHFAGNLRQKHE